MTSMQVTSEAAQNEELSTEVGALLAWFSSGGAQADAASAESAGLNALGHGLQCAINLAQRYPEDVELQVAGLVHDLGHRVRPGAADAHGVVGADLVRNLLGERVADLVELHVPAKRYLVTTDPTYRAQLSPMSVITLAEQGGDLDAEGIAEFEAHPHHQAALALRRADEDAKVPGLEVPGLDHWKPYVLQVARRVQQQPQQPQSQQQ